MSQAALVEQAIHQPSCGRSRDSPFLRRAVQPNASSPRGTSVAAPVRCSAWFGGRWLFLFVSVKLFRQFVVPLDAFRKFVLIGGEFIIRCLRDFLGGVIHLSRRGRLDR